MVFPSVFALSSLLQLLLRAVVNLSVSTQVVAVVAKATLNPAQATLQQLQRLLQ
jgi:hypothetical protein